MEQFLLWIISWAQLCDGLIGIFSYGYIRSKLALRTAKYLAKWRYKND